MSTKVCKLPGCNKAARRKFCSNKHKDRFHNINNPRGKFAHLHPDSQPNHLLELMERKERCRSPSHGQDDDDYWNFDDMDGHFSNEDN